MDIRPVRELLKQLTAAVQLSRSVVHPESVDGRRISDIIHLLRFEYGRIFCSPVKNEHDLFLPCIATTGLLQSCQT